MLTIGLLFYLIHVILSDDVEIDPWDLAYLENFGGQIQQVTKPQVDLIRKPPIVEEKEQPAKKTLGPDLEIRETKTICEDRAANCFAIQKQCTESSYDDMMFENCARTCGYCDCRDLSTRCAYWEINGFCSSLIHSQAVKKRTCAKTCKLCD
ncbi:unnamed protein product [Bursaphelenchus xylophilus]|uniref:(pine wood nematode) hypothetical protein n=1 Tax=Bursaphelenchus xylophilus TaxID=6326 RepID=A0A1I7S2Z8_BURXY|nr:unnamed protein product [Bursaphelenchus xylophilus]CAG9116043.1 unnamed protein product [Bursaphelenchus xylophilus]